MQLHYNMTQKRESMKHFKPQELFNENFERNLVQFQFQKLHVIKMEILVFFNLEPRLENIFFLLVQSTPSPSGSSSCSVPYFQGGSNQVTMNWKWWNHHFLTTNLVTYPTLIYITSLFSFNWKIRPFYFSFLLYLFYIMLIIVFFCYLSISEMTLFF